MGVFWGDGKVGAFLPEGLLFLGEGAFGKMDYPFVHVICTCMTGAGGWEPGCWVGSHCVNGRFGGHGCGRNVGICGS